MRQVLTLGRLVNLEILDPRTGRGRIISVRGKWLATSPGGRDLLICQVKGRSPSNPNEAIRKAHRRFHLEPPKGMWAGEAPAPVGRLQQVGLLKSLTYTVPQSIHSPEKNPYHWHHAFGDTGHRGGDHYPQKMMPAILKDSRGHLFIRRRPGNIFKTTDWIRG